MHRLTFPTYRFLPPHGCGLRIGLLGGSFNPPHEGHRLASITALKRFGLDRVWWLVTPGNPLKDNRALPGLEARISAANEVARHPRIAVTGIEAWLGTRFTAQTLFALRERCPGVQFVWLMGADNLVQFHRWQNWRLISRLMPIGVIDRPGSTHMAVRSRAATALGRWRMDESDGLLLPTRARPSWMFVHGKRSALSSTALRRAMVSGAETLPG